MTPRYTIVHVHPRGIDRHPAPGTKAEARAAARQLAEATYPRDEGYRWRWSADCVMVFRDGEHVGDVAVELAR